MPRNKRKNLVRAIEHRADKNADIRLGNSVTLALVGSHRVAKALTMIDGPAAPRGAQEEFGSMCLPEVAKYAAGYRKSTNVTAR